MAKTEKKKADGKQREQEKKPSSPSSMTRTKAGPDDPIYKRGFVIGGYYSKNSFPNTREKSLPEEERMPEEERHQDPKRKMADAAFEEYEERMKSGKQQPK